MLPLVTPLPRTRTLPAGVLRRFCCSNCTFNRELLHTHNRIPYCRLRPLTSDRSIGAPPRRATVGLWVFRLNCVYVDI